MGATWGGNESPSADDIKTILSSVGIDADDEKLGKVISELSGKSIDDVIAAGNAKLASVPSGGGAVAVSGGGDAAEEAKEEEKKEESEEEESDDDMGFGLFD